MTERAVPRPSLVIVSGQPRSGTTWLGKLFDSHPATLYRHEPDSTPIPLWLPLVVERDHDAYAEALRTYVATIPRLRATKVSASSPTFPKTWHGPLRDRAVRGLVDATRLAASAGLRVRVPRFCLPRDRDAYVLVWKTIESSLRLGLYARALEGVRIVHVLRHPGGVIASRLRGERRNRFGGYRASEDWPKFALLLGTAVAARHGLTLERLRAMDPVERLAWECVISMDKALDDLDGRAEARVVVYEELCARPHETMADLFAFCALDLAPQTEEFLRASTASDTGRYYSVFKDPARSAWRWKEELTPDEQAIVQRTLEHSRAAHLWSTPASGAAVGGA